MLTRAGHTQNGASEQGCAKHAEAQIAICKLNDMLTLYQHNCDCNSSHVRAKSCESRKHVSNTPGMTHSIRSSLTWAHSRELHSLMGGKLKTFCSRHESEVRCVRCMRMALLWCSLVALECASLVHTSAKHL